MSEKDRFIQIIRQSMAACLWLAATTSACAGITGSDVVNSDGTVTYSYLVDNTGGSFDVAAWSLEFGFTTPDWLQQDTLSGGTVTVPNSNWFADVGIPVTGQSAQDFLSLAPAGDVAVGTTLNGFSFTSTFLPGTVDYHEFSATGDSISGKTIGPAPQSVPEGSGPMELIGIASVAFFAAGTGRSRRVLAGARVQ